MIKGTMTILLIELFLPFQLGYELKEDEIESVFRNFKAMAEKTKVNN